jgi:nucleotide-binding universal stress UspA family protein
MPAEYGVLVAVDGSAESEAAVRWAAEEAALRHLPITLMHVVVPVVVSYPVRYLKADYQRWQEENAESVLDAASTIAQQATDVELTIQREVRHGGAATELIVCSKKSAITVVGSRGLGALGAGLLGSVSRGLLHYSTQPVAVIRARESLSDRSLPVLVGIDGSPASEAATALAYDEASRRGVDLVALHAWSDVSTAMPGGPEQDVYEQEGAEILGERLAGWQDEYPDVKVWRKIVRDQPARWLLEEAKRAQLVVVGSRGRGGFTRLMLGSVSTTVAESSATPVVVVPGGRRD